MAEANLTTVRVTLEDRDDGGLRVHSNDLPGLILSGPDRKVVIGQIAPAIEALFRHGPKLEVQVKPARDLHEVLRDPSPRDVDMHCQEAVFVVVLPKAA